MSIHFQCFTFLMLCLTLPAPAALGQTSELIDCSRSTETITLDSDAHLDPSCVYTGGFKIATSGVTLDCRGALIEDVDGIYSHGILISQSTDVDLSDVTVKNCEIKGFNTNLMVARNGYAELEYGHEYENAFTNILIEDSVSTAPRKNGMYLLAYVTGVTFRGVDIGHSPAVGLYMSTGARDNRVENSYIHHNGLNGLDPIEYSYGSHSVYVQETGREGIAMDGARYNTIVGNVLESNVYGGLFLYKNCGEYGGYPRPYGADYNVIEGNTFRDQDIGVWVGSRMAQNLFWQECADPAYIDGPLVSIVEDFATGNTIKDNTFINIAYGVRIEGDATQVTGNVFQGDDRGDVAIVLGTRFRTEALNRPVLGSVILENESSMSGSPAPYCWVHGHIETTFLDNSSEGEAANLRQGKQPDMEPFLLTEKVYFIEAMGDH